jgi:hypothetical protein
MVLAEISRRKFLATAGAVAGNFSYGPAGVIRSSSLAGFRATTALTA